MVDSTGPPPNILVVLFDCLRAQDFPGGSDEVSGMPFARRVMNESLVFPRTVSPAPWTIPSHASLFTGLYPWENNVHAYKSLMADPAIPRLPSLLHARGYRTLSLAANPFVSPRFDLVRGFDKSEWGGWWEPFLRTPRDEAPNTLEGEAPTTAQPQDRTMEWIRDGPLGNVLRSASQHSYRYPFALDGGSRLLNRLRYPETPRDISQTPWIESELATWLGRQSNESPVFCFLNLTDTHEPYYPDPELVHGARNWWRLTKVRQDHACAVSGEWDPSSFECHQLRELYRMMVRHLDVRLKAIVQAFRDAGRWDNTLLVVTSDHGQSLGEKGMMFHLLRLDEPLIRIPLWVRPVGGTGGGRQAVGWTSLIDVAPTLLEVAGVPFDPYPSALPLRGMIDAPRPGPVFSMSDGIVWPHIRRRFPADREKKWDRPFVAAYLEDYKIITCAVDDETHAFNLSQDPSEAKDLWPSKEEALVSLLADARQVGSRLLGGDIHTEAIVEERLRSWGYI